MPRHHATARELTPFQDWTTDLDLVCRKRLGMSLHDLPDMATRDGFDAGDSPEEFFEETLVPLLREDHGVLVDDALDVSDG